MAFPYRGAGHGLRPVCHRRRLGRGAVRADRGRARGAHRHRGGAVLGRHLRQCRMRAEEAAGASGRVWRLRRGRRGIRLGDPQGAASLGQADRRQGRRDHPIERHLPPPAGKRGGTHLRGARAPARRAHGRGRRRPRHRRAHRPRHRRPSDAPRHPWGGAWHRLRRRVLPPQDAEARRRDRQRLHRGRVRRDLRHARGHGGPRLPAAPPVAGLRRRSAPGAGRGAATPGNPPSCRLCAAQRRARREGARTDPERRADDPTPTSCFSPPGGGPPRTVSA